MRGVVRKTTMGTHFFHPNSFVFQEVRAREDLGKHIEPTSKSTSLYVRHSTLFPTLTLHIVSFSNIMPLLTKTDCPKSRI